ncbi:MAG: hypothetical protein GY749_26725, partial [Desulfobacteraceae bacterium]|nr:hypothetical protein [Desulfobacteraceae bacterium]
MGTIINAHDRTSHNQSMKRDLGVTKTAHLVPTLCVGMQAGRSASGCPQEDCFRQPETGRGASRLRSHA